MERAIASFSILLITGCSGSSSNIQGSCAAPVLVSPSEKATWAIIRDGVNSSMSLEVHEQKNILLTRNADKNSQIEFTLSQDPYCGDVVYRTDKEINMIDEYFIYGRPPTWKLVTFLLEERSDTLAKNVRAGESIPPEFGSVPLPKPECGPLPEPGSEPSGDANLVCSDEYNGTDQLFPPLEEPDCERLTGENGDRVCSYEYVYEGQTYIWQETRDDTPPYPGTGLINFTLTLNEEVLLRIELREWNGI